MKIRVFQIRLSNNYLIEDQETINSFIETVSVKKTSCQFVENDHTNYWSVLVFYDPKAVKEPKAQTPEKLSYSSDSELTDNERIIVDNFKIWRQTKANELRVPVFMICSNSEIISLAKIRPDSINQLLKIKGFGEQKIAKFGDEIIALLNSM